MAESDIIVLNQPGLTRRERSSGRVQFTVEVKSEPLIHSFDPKTLGKVVAEAMANALREKVLAITAVASPALQASRAGAAKAFAAGKSYAMKRYGGGRIGPMPPNQSDRMFNDSGRMAKSIQATPRDDSWTIVMAANRLDPATATGGELGVQRIFRKLVELVPAFGNTKSLFDEKGVKDSVTQSIGMMIVKARETRDQLSEARAKAALNLAKQAFALVRGLAVG